MIRVPLIALVLMTAACGQATTTVATDAQVEAPTLAMPQTAEEATAQDACGAAAFQSLVGTVAAQIDQATLPAGARIITPETIVTQDFRPDRLNILTGTDGIVSSLSCY